MRCAVAVCFGLVIIGLSEARQARAIKPLPRYGIDADLDTYRQATAKDTLRSVLKAIDIRRIDYMLAHLADPEFVDPRVKQLDGRFEDLVRITTENLADDPESVRDLRRFLGEGEWEETGGSAIVKHKEIKARQAFFRRINDRWFLENRRQPAK